MTLAREGGTRCGRVVAVRALQAVFEEGYLCKADDYG
jgi:hypothetical protein